MTRLFFNGKSGGLLVPLFFLLCSNAAHAVVYTYQYMGWFDTATNRNSACAAWHAAHNPKIGSGCAACTGTNTWTASPNCNSGSGTCSQSQIGLSEAIAYQFLTCSDNICPPGTTLDGTLHTCTCPNGAQNPGDGCDQCPSGSHWVTATSECVQDAACEQGQQDRFQSLTEPPANAYCKNGCEYILPPQSGSPDIPGGVILGVDGMWAGDAVGTGNACTPNNPRPEMQQQCVVDGDGDTACFVPLKPNCGEFNGKEFCAPNIPDNGVCILGTSGVGYICNGATPPLYDDGSAPHEAGTIQGDTNGDGTKESGTVFTPGGNYNGNNDGGGSSGGGSSSGGSGGSGCGDNGIPCSWSDGSTASPYSDLTAQLTAAKEAFTQSAEAAHESLETAFGIDSLSVSGSCSSGGGITLLGIHIEIDLCPWLDYLDYIGYAVMVIAAVSAVFILLGA